MTTAERTIAPKYMIMDLVEFKGIGDQVTRFDRISAIDGEVLWRKDQDPVVRVKYQMRSSREWVTEDKIVGYPGEHDGEGCIK